MRRLPTWTGAFPLLLLAALPLAAQGDDALAARTKGKATAPVTVYEMSDFQCPFCKRHAEETFPGLEKEYIAAGKVRWIFVNYPLTSIHANAVPAATFAICAARSGKFWPAHDLLFRHQKLWAPLKNPAAFFLSLADSLRLERPAVTRCVQDSTVVALIRTDSEGARRSGATSTPTFYIEGGIIAGAWPIEVWRPILDSIYRAKTAR